LNLVETFFGEAAAGLLARMDRLSRFCRGTIPGARCGGSLDRRRKR